MYVLIILFPRTESKVGDNGWWCYRPTNDQRTERSTVSLSSRGKKGMYLRRYNTPRANPHPELCLGPIDPSPSSKHHNSRI